MDQNIMTILSGILTMAGTVVSYFISQAAKKHSNVKNIDTLEKLANQAVAWVEKNFNENPEKLSEAINYVTEEAKKLKIKTNPAQIEAQIETSLAQLKKNFALEPLKTAESVVHAAVDLTEQIAQETQKASDVVFQALDEAVTEPKDAPRPPEQGV